MKTSYPSVDRALGQLIALSGVLLMVVQYLKELERNPPAMIWWQVLSDSTLLLLIVVGAFSRILPIRVLRALWIVIPVAGFLTILLTFPAYLGSAPQSYNAWQWRLTGAYVSFLVLLLPPARAIVSAIAAGFLPALSGLLAFGHVPETAAQMVPIQITNFAFTVIFIGIRAGMNRFHESELEAQAARARSARSIARAREEARFSRLVHDHVLATLAAAMRFDGAPPSELRSSARTALALLTDNTSAGAAASGAVSTAELAERLNALARRSDWEREIRTSADSGTIPGVVAGALQDAAAEAMRNADRHAGPNAAKRITVRIAPTEISISICDDGAGFEPERLAHDRLGVRESILHRMRAVQGGRAQVRSAPGIGTEVVLLWQA